MKLNGNKNIIFDSDIITTNGEHLGESLDATLNSYDGDISELKRNVKFLYQYGGIGSKGGGGGSSSEEWNIYATLNKVQLNSNYIYLDGIGSYKLQIKINKPGGLSYRVSYSFKNSSGQQEPSSETLNLDNMYSTSKTVYLDINDSIIVTVTSEDGDTKQVSANFVTQPYTFNLYFADDNDQRYLTLNNDLFISDIQNRGLYAYLDYNIGIQGTVMYKYYNFNNELSEYQTLDLSEESKSGKEKLKLADSDFFINSNAGYYTVRVDIELQPIGQQPFIVTRVINCNLIPSTLYLKLTPQIEDAILYDSDSQEDPYSFSLGNNTFILQPFQGQNQGRQYQIDPVLINSSGESISFNTIYVKEREQYFYTLMISGVGWNKLSFTLRIGSESYTVNKYLYIKSDSNNLRWEDFSLKNNLAYQYYVHSEGQTSEFASVFSMNRQLTQSLAESPKYITFTRPNDNSVIHDTLISFAVQYSSINEVSQNILQISDGNDSNLIFVYQNKITIGQTPINIFIPKQDQLDSSDSNKFNLITIYKKFYKTINNQNYYEVLVYIDGILEGALPTFSDTEIYYKSIKFNNVNFICNLFDVKYYSPYKQVINGVEQEVSTFKDPDITRYYYTYASKYNKTLSSDINNLVKINNCLNDFQIDTLYGNENTRMVSLPDATLNNLCNIESLDPVLVLDITDTKDYSSANEGETENFVKWYQRRVPENTEDLTSIEVAVSYKAKGSTTLEKIETPSDAQFYIKKQGTSTRSWFAKNLDLCLQSTSEDNIYLFTPNLQTLDSGDSEEQIKEKSNTFLPEEKFTLKKDVVDSAHSNNNAIADFVNRNTKKFDTGESAHPYYRYIKNCLTGFPCLVFARVEYTNAQGQKLQNIYYLGIYNFNLGRDSYYNLGYKSLYNISSQDHELQNGFKIYSISRDVNNTFKPGIEVAEVLDNLEYYDFSQYDQSILFGAKDEDTTRMFGKLVYSSSLEANIKNHIKRFVKGISAAGGYIFDQLHKNYGPPKDKYNAIVTNELGEFVSSRNQVPDYRIQYKREFDEERNEYVYKSLDETITDSTENSLIDAILGNKESEENIILPLVDYRSLVEYYVIIMAFGMLDSIEKNLNIKSWNSGNTFYTAFYDMDTALGLDNGGNNVSYFAFSDYWDLVDGNILSKAIIYRDFFLSQGTNTSELKGFDVPSSYLFAIAKYAKLILKDNPEFTETFPLEYWAKLRAHNGELRNAKYFMNTYYSNRTADIGEGLLNLDYRATYLLKPVQDSQILNGYESTDFIKFNGHRKYYTEHWLSERLHILDVYMGLVSTGDVNRYIQYLDPNTNKWKTIIADSGNPLKEVDILTDQRPVTNSDIIVYKDIFGEPRKYNETISVNIKALENSFVVVNISGNETSQYMIKDPNVLYNLVLTFNGSNNTTIGGSDRWTYISDLAPFISSSTSGFSVNSTNLQNFYLGRSGTLTSAIGGYMPSVKEIVINGKNYVFNLSNINTIFPNVLNINIDQSSINLNVANSNVKTISARDVNASSLIIQNCNYLESLNLSGSTFSDRIEINPYSKDIEMTDVNTRNIIITAIGSNRKITIRNNDLLQNITLNGFETIEISNCSNLQSVQLGEDSQNKIKQLSITNCSYGQSVQKLTICPIGISSNDDIDLSSFTYLKKVNFKQTKKFNTVKLPNNCELVPGCFMLTSITDIKSVTNGVVYITGNSTFRQSNITTLDCVRVKDSVTDLSYTFDVTSGGSAKLNLTSVQNFLSNIPSNNNVTNISWMFGSQSKIDYFDNTGGLEEYNEGYCSINLDKFTKVTNAYGVFAASSVSFLNKYMFRYIGTKNDNPQHYVNLNGIFKWKSSSQLVCTIDSLEYIIPKIESVLMITTGRPGNATDNISGSTTPIKIISTNEELPKLREFLRCNYDDVSRITQIYGLQFVEKYDYEYLFTDFSANELWENLEVICYCFNNIDINNFQSLGTKQLPKLKYVYKSFNNLTLNKYIDLYNIVKDWSNFKINSTAGVLISEISSVYTSANNNLFYDCFNPASGQVIKKYINKVNYNNIWSNINCQYYSRIGNLFENTILISSNSQDINIPEPNLNIIETNNTFAGFEIINTNVTDQNSYDNLNPNNKIPINLDDFISNIKNCIIFNGTFQKITLYRTLPYDFFKRRYEVQQNVWYKENEQDEPQGAIYYKYYYNNNITSLEKCFYQVKIDGNPYFDPTDFISQLPKNRIICNNEEKDYYVDLITEEQIYPERNIEIDDSEGVIVHHYSNSNYSVGTHNFEIKKIGDLDTNAEYNNKFFIAPDLLYGCAKGCNLTECFAQSDFAGALPKHLIKQLGETAKLDDWLYQVHILPQYVGTYRHGNDVIMSSLTNKQKKIYTFVPESFGENISRYNKAFTFYQRFPPKFLDDDTQINAYYIFLDVSFKNLQYLTNSLPVYLSPFTRNSRTVVVNGVQWNQSDYLNEGKTYYNIMFNTKLIQGDVSGTDGISYQNMDIDNLFVETYINIGFGYLFSGNIPLRSYHRASDNPAIYFCGNTSKLQIILPQSVSNEDQTINSYLSIPGSNGWTTTKINENYIIGQYKEKYKVNNDIVIS